jgi:glycosyltransferase involved in cell wall biosynthesis
MTCIYYHPEAYSTSGPKLMGRNAAGESFLRGFFTYSQSDAFWAHVQNDQHAQHFIDAARSFNRVESVHAIYKSTLKDLSKSGAMFYPGPEIGKYAWQRAAFGHDAWALCGITHTTSSAGSMDAIAELITAPIQPWDALICTSHAVKTNVMQVLHAQIDYLKNRLGLTTITLPELPVIPLGIHTNDFLYDQSVKKQSRETLCVADDALIVLFMGRLSFHAKAHPLAMYQAVERAAISSGKEVVLVECGWHANEFIAKAYVEAAKLACPSVRIISLDGRLAENRQIAWASGDVFCSLSDNIQETFGITPIEAMAAGLPVVVSDWDGYRDTVRDGIDGFRIPTLMPQAGSGGDLALRHALEIDNYDHYCGYTSSFIAVDVMQTSNALIKLFESSALRKKMGQSGQERARTIFDWRVIIPQYEALWAEQNRIRKSPFAKKQKLVNSWPARMDPFFSFGEYPTQTLTPETMLSVVDFDVEKALTRILAYRQLAMVDYAKLVLPTEAEIRMVLSRGGKGSKSALDLVVDIGQERRPMVLRSLAWMVKLGVLTYSS